MFRYLGIFRVFFLIIICSNVSFLVSLFVGQPLDATWQTGIEIRVVGRAIAKEKGRCETSHIAAWESSRCGTRVLTLLPESPHATMRESPSYDVKLPSVIQ